MLKYIENKIFFRKMFQTEVVRFKKVYLYWSHPFDSGWSPRSSIVKNALFSIYLAFPDFLKILYVRFDLTNISYYSAQLSFRVRFLICLTHGMQICIISSHYTDLFASLLRKWVRLRTQSKNRYACVFCE